MSLFDRFRFGKLPIHEVYKMVEVDDIPDMMGVQIIKGKYAGITYVYGSVSMNELKEIGKLQLSFQIMVLENPTKFVTNSKEFHNLAGDILQHILQTEQGDYQEFKI